MDFFMWAVALLLLWTSLSTHHTTAADWLQPHQEQYRQHRCKNFLSRCDRQGTTCFRLVYGFVHTCKASNESACSNLPRRCEKMYLSLKSLSMFRHCSCENEPTQELKIACGYIKNFVKRHPCYSKQFRTGSRMRSLPNADGPATHARKPSAQSSVVSKDELPCRKYGRRCKDHPQCSEQLKLITEKACQSSSEGRCLLQDTCARELQHAHSTPHLAQVLNCTCSQGSSRRRCRREYKRVVNNKCIKDIRNPPDPSCEATLGRCSQNEDCLSLVTLLINKCQNVFNSRNCRLDECYQEIAHFYRSLRDRTLAEELAFCTKCSPNRPVCAIIRGNIEDKCSATRVKSPPTCTDLLTDCERDQSYCRDNYREFLYSCEERSGGCLRETATCRRAVLGLYGSMLPRSCDCPSQLNARRRAQCNSTYTKLHKNACVDTALYVEPRKNPHTSAVVKVADDTYRVERAREVEDLCEHSDVKEINEPVQVYVNETDCYLRCTCRRDWSRTHADCDQMLCPQPRSCQLNDKSQLADLVVHTEDNRMCVCWGSEIICSRADSDQSIPDSIFTSGTTILAGYSQREAVQLFQFGYTFSPEVVTKAITSTLTKGAVEGNCRVQTLRNSPGHLIINFSTRSSATQQQALVCEDEARRFMSSINSRDPSLKNQVRLNSIKVANRYMHSGAITLKHNDCNSCQNAAIPTIVIFTLISVWSAR